MTGIAVDGAHELGYIGRFRDGGVMFLWNCGQRAPQVGGDVALYHPGCNCVAEDLAA